MTRIWHLLIGSLALLVVPALLVEDSASATLRHAATVVNWVVWVAFCVDLVARLILRNRVQWGGSAWFDLTLIVLSPPFLAPDYLQATRAASALRIVRILRLVRVGSVAVLGLRTLRRALQHHKFHYVGMLGGAVVALGALAIYAVEHDTNKNVATIADALWWAVVTVTTVGYGDVSPVTTEGRIIAAILMVTGIGVIGVFTATIASYFVEQREDTELPIMAIDERLQRLEAKVDELLSLAARTGKN